MNDSRQNLLKKLEVNPLGRLVAVRGLNTSSQSSQRLIRLPSVLFEPRQGLPRLPHLAEPDWRRPIYC